MITIKWRSMQKHFPLKTSIEYEDVWSRKYKILNDISAILNKAFKDS